MLLAPPTSKTGSSSSRERREAGSTTTARSIDNDSSPEPKRLHRSKESSFLYKYGHRHHSYDPEKAPYPLSYDKEAISLDLLDHGVAGSISTSLFDWKEQPPSDVLDLGCGSGAWIVDAAKRWPNCRFVGFDLVNIQPPLSYLDKSVVERVRWVHGNFLTTKLPFEDDTFDFVKVSGIASGVPENKWSVLFSEIHRVLSPGGIMESIEEDIIFPTLPRWFTNPLRSRSRRTAAVHLPDGSQRSTPPLSAQTDGLQHDHALLESLFYSIFESRFINCRPTSILPAFATAVFPHVEAAPILNFKMPPLAPVMPSPNVPPPLLSLATPPPRIEKSPSTSLSTVSSDNCSSVDFDFSSTLDREEDASSHGTTSSFSSVDSGSSPDQQRLRQLNGNWRVPEETAAMGFSKDSSFLNFTNFTLPMQKFMSLAPETMATQLYRTSERVLACQEAMWEQLKDWVRNKPQELRALGWDDDELGEMQGRKKFETLIQRYRDDMRCRVALWYSLTRMGWNLPPQGPLTRAEIHEEDCLRQAMLDARKFASPEDMQKPCRSIRMLIGFKGTS